MSQAGRVRPNCIVNKFRHVYATQNNLKYPDGIVNRLKHVYGIVNKFKLF